MRRWIVAAMVSVGSLFGGGASAYDVIVHNCTAETLRVITFDQDDLVRMVPYAEYDIPSLGAAVTQCVGRTECYVRVFYGGYSGPGEGFQTGGPLYIRYSGLIGLYKVPSCQFS